MKKGFLVIAFLVAALFMATPVLADMPAPGDGPAFGQHVSGMAPQHPLEYGGAMFGACVSTMAQGDDCPHTH
ncbi:MAG: hypothetical protein HY664_04300 [Chloroflexi bacterium]|nr:hypothetical protein [Chloroflexota bacterium]